MPTSNEGTALYKGMYVRDKTDKNKAKKQRNMERSNQSKGYQGETKQAKILKSFMGRQMINGLKVKWKGNGSSRGGKQLAIFAVKWRGGISFRSSFRRVFFERCWLL